MQYPGLSINILKPLLTQGIIDASGVQSIVFTYARLDGQSPIRISVSLRKEEHEIFKE